MKLPDGHLRMIEAVACTNPNTVVVLLCGGVVECPWEERVKAILYMGLPGQAGGEAVADLLYGCAIPAENWPKAGRTGMKMYRLLNYTEKLRTHCIRKGFTSATGTMTRRAFLSAGRSAMD